MKLIKKAGFETGEIYETGYHTDSGVYIRGREAQCISISPDRKKAIFRIGEKEQEYDLIGEMPGAEIVEDEKQGRGFVVSEAAVIPWEGQPPVGPYTSILSHKLISHITMARKKAGLSQAKMAEIFEIPKRTIENWEANVNRPPIWAEKLILEKLERMAKEKEKAD